MQFEENFVFPVYIYENMIQKVMSFCKNIENEIFGYLIGTILKWDDQNYIIIDELLFLLGAIYSDKYSTSQIEGTAGIYESKFQRIKKHRNNPSLRILGWFHSHPDFGCFLSTTDVETQQYFFPESYQVALVVDPIRDELEFFTLDNNSEKEYKPISYAILTQNNIKKQGLNAK